jgi:hypothetical protein
VPSTMGFEGSRKAWDVHGLGQRRYIYRVPVAHFDAECGEMTVPRSTRLSQLRDGGVSACRIRDLAVIIGFPVICRLQPPRVFVR